MGTIQVMREVTLPPNIVTGEQSQSSFDLDNIRQKGLDDLLSLIPNIHDNQSISNFISFIMSSDDIKPSETTLHISKSLRSGYVQSLSRLYAPKCTQESYTFLEQVMLGLVFGRTDKSESDHPMPIRKAAKIGRAHV